MKTGFLLEKVRENNGIHSIFVFIIFRQIQGGGGGGKVERG